MYYVSFERPDGQHTWGVEIDGLVYDLGPSGAARAADLTAAISTGVFGAVEPDDLAATPSFPSSDITYLPPIPHPGKIICIGVNYHAHRVEGNRPEAPTPTVFTRFADSQMGHLESAVKPRSTTLFDYEGEMALVVGTGGYHIPADEAYDHVAGYAAYNDFSARDWQRSASQWVPGKNFPATGGFGPYLVPAADIDDITALRLQTRVNGEVRQDAFIDQLIFDIPALIEYVSGFTPLSPGDVIVTGTPGGVGVFMEPPALLNDGDVVEVEITGLGTLRNTVSDEATE
jgi:2-keto-4-pentenoate hydratase/2-oxohepta-3-ene-1,7-dioic acid hydratase in catechol pathway